MCMPIGKHLAKPQKGVSYGVDRSNAQNVAQNELSGMES